RAIENVDGGAGRIEGALVADKHREDQALGLLGVGVAGHDLEGVRPNTDNTARVELAVTPLDYRREVVDVGAWVGVGEGSQDLVVGGDILDSTRRRQRCDGERGVEDVEGGYAKLGRAARVRDQDPEWQPGTFLRVGVGAEDAEGAVAVIDDAAG